MNVARNMDKHASQPMHAESTTESQIRPMHFTKRLIPAIQFCSTVLSAVLVCGCHSGSRTAEWSSLSDEHFSLVDAIPRGQTEVEILTIRYSERGEELGKKIQAGMAEHRTWLLDQIKKSPGEPLAYHSNLGVTRSEYAEFGKLKPELVVAARGLVWFTVQADVVTVSTGDSQAPLDNARLNLRTRQLQTLHGVVENPEWKTNADKSIPIGPYEGFRWYYEDDNGTNELEGTFLSLDILRRTETGKILWRFKQGTMKDGQVQRYEIIFQYRPPASREPNKRPSSPIQGHAALKRRS